LEKYQVDSREKGSLISILVYIVTRIIYRIKALLGYSDTIALNV